MINNFLKCIFPVLVLISFSNSVNATHIRGGYIKAERISVSLTFRIELIVFTDESAPGEVQFGNGIMDFGDGSDPIIRPRELDDPRVISFEEEVDSVGLGIEFNRIIFEHEFPAGFTSYLISYQEPNRNEDVINILNSVNTPFYIETFIVLDDLLGSSNTPAFLFPSTYIIKSGTENKFSASAVDSDGDSLAYRLVVPQQNRGVDVSSYSFPGSESLNNFDNDSLFFINSVSGLITWQNPLTTGEYVVSVEVEEWREFQDDAFLIGRSINDFQLIVEDFSDSIPEINLNNQVCVTLEEPVSEVIAFSSRGSSRLDFIHDESFPLEFSTNSGIDIPDGFELSLSWVPEEGFVTERPYVIVFRNMDSLGISRYEEMVLSFSCNDFQLENFNDTISGASSGLEQPDVILSTIFETGARVYAYPNPVSKSITIDFEAAKSNNIKVSLMSISGSEEILFYGRTDSGNKLELELNSKISNGLYILQIEDNTSVYRQKIMVER